MEVEQITLFLAPLTYVATLALAQNFVASPAIDQEIVKFMPLSAAVLTSVDAVVAYVD